MPVATDYVIANGTGTAVLADLNSVFGAIVTNNSSNSEPATKYAYMWWADTSAGLLKIRNSNNDGWVTLFQLDGTLTLEDGSNSAPAIGFRDDDNTGIFSSAADNLDITTGGTTRVNVSSAGINVTGTVTDDGASHDGDVTFIGASANINFDKSDNALEFADNAKAVFGNDSDLQIYHDGTNSVFTSSTGQLSLRGNDIRLLNNGASKALLKAFDNGAVELYFNAVKKFETTANGIDVTGQVKADEIYLLDNEVVKVGTGGDLQILHNGSDSFVRDLGTGGLYMTGSVVGIRNSGANEDGLLFAENGAIQLFFDHSKKFETTSSGVTVSGGVAATAFSVGDGQEIKLGDSNDLKLFHNGSHSYIADVGTGDLRITGSAIHLQNAGQSENMLKSFQDGAVELYFDNAKKFQTTSTGTKISGSENIENSVNALSNLNVASNYHLYLSNPANDANEAVGLCFGLSLGGEIGASIYHKRLGTNSYGDLMFATKPSGGSVTERLKITSGGDIHVTGDKGIFLGANNDLMLAHDGSSTRIEDTFGFLAIKSNAIEFRSNTDSELYASYTRNGSVELYFDNAKKLETVTGGANVTGALGVNTTSPASTIDARATSGATITARNTGTAASIAMSVGSSTNQLVSRGINSSTARDLLFMQGNTTAVKIDTSNNFLITNDNAKLQIGASQDLQLFHTGTYSNIYNATGDLDISSDVTRLKNGNRTENFAAFINNGQAELYYDNVKRFETTSSGVTVSGGLTCGGAIFSGAVNIPDNYLFSLGSSNDLQLFHNGSNSYISNRGAGAFVLEADTGENGIVLAQNGSVDLYYDHSKKLETTSTGIDVNGSVTADDIITAGALLHEGDTDTLVHFSAADTIDLKTSGTERLRINNSGVSLFGVLYTNGRNISLGDSGSATDDRITFGESQDLQIYHNGNHSIINDTGTGFLVLGGSKSKIMNSNMDENCLTVTENGAVELYFDNAKKLETTSTGIHVLGQLTTVSNVGIGTTSPNINNGYNTLTLNSSNLGGVLAFSQNDSRKGLIYTESTGDLKIQTESGRDMHFATGGSTDRLTITSDGHLQIPNDTGKLQLGASQDLSIYHDGSSSYILDNGTGHLNIKTNGTQIILTKTPHETLAVFNVDGNNELYFDGTKKFETTANGTQLSGTIHTVVGDFYPSNDNSERLGLSNRNWEQVNGYELYVREFSRHFDNVQARFGNDDDLKILHNGFTSIINSPSHTLGLYSGVNHHFLNADGTETSAKFTTNGSAELYFDNSKKLETYANGIKLGDNVLAAFGDDIDLLIHHTGGTGYIKNQTGNFYIQNDGVIIIGNQSASTTGLKFNDGGSIELYHNNNKKFETLSDGVNITGTLKVNGSAISTGGLGNVVEDTTPQLGGDLQSNGNDIDFADNDKAVFGTGGDLSIYHDGDNNYIDGNSAAEDHIYIRANVGSDHSSNIHLQAKAGEESIVCRDDEQVELYYDGSQKFKTTSFGCTVQGGITFGSDTAAANQFDDYEEGVFTPSLEFGGATTGITYASMRGGSYVKIGRQVTVNFGFTLTSKGSASGDATIAGLPFAVEDLLSSTSVEASGVSSFWNDVATDSANIVFAATNSSSELQIRHTVGAEDDTDDMQEGDFENNTALRGSITYFTAT